MSGEAPESGSGWSQISCPGAFRVQLLPVEATSSCAKPVAVLASSCSRATPVLAVFFSTAPVTPPAAEWLTDSTLLRLVAFDHEQRIGGAVDDPGAGGATGQGEVREPDARRGHLRRGPHRARDRQARAQHSDAVHPAVDGQQVVSSSRGDLVGEQALGRAGDVVDCEPPAL